MEKSSTNQVKLSTGAIVCGVILITMNLVIFISGLISTYIGIDVNSSQGKIDEYTKLGLEIPNVPAIITAVVISFIALVGLFLTFKKYKEGIFIYGFSLILKVCSDLYLTITTGGSFMAIITSLLIPIVFVGFIYNQLGQLNSFKNK